MCTGPGSSSETTRKQKIEFHSNASILKVRGGQARVGPKPRTSELY